MKKLMYATNLKKIHFNFHHHSSLDMNLQLFWAIKKSPTTKQRPIYVELFELSKNNFTLYWTGKFKKKNINFKNQKFYLKKYKIKKFNLIKNK